MTLPQIIGKVTQVVQVYARQQYLLPNLHPCILCSRVSRY